MDFKLLQTIFKAKKILGRYKIGVQLQLLQL